MVTKFSLFVSLSLIFLPAPALGICRVEEKIGPESLFVTKACEQTRASLLSAVQSVAESLKEGNWPDKDEGMPETWISIGKDGLAFNVRQETACIEHIFPLPKEKKDTSSLELFSNCFKKLTIPKRPTLETILKKSKEAEVCFGEIVCVSKDSIQEVDEKFKKNVTALDHQRFIIREKAMKELTKDIDDSTGEKLARMLGYLKGLPLIGADPQKVESIQKLLKHAKVIPEKHEFKTPKIDGSEEKKEEPPQFIRHSPGNPTTTH